MRAPLGAFATFDPLRDGGDGLMVEFDRAVPRFALESVEMNLLAHCTDNVLSVVNEGASGLKAWADIRWSERSEYEWRLQRDTVPSTCPFGGDVLGVILFARFSAVVYAHYSVTVKVLRFFENFQHGVQTNAFSVVAECI